MKTIKTLALGLIAVQMTSACGIEPKQANAEKANIQLTQKVEQYSVQSFSEGRLRLPKVTMFLWKENLKAEDVKDVLYNSAVLNKCEQNRVEAAAQIDPIIDKLKGQKTALNDGKKAANAAKEASQKNLDAAQSEISKLNALLAEKNGQRESLVLNRDAEIDQAKIEELNGQILALDTEIAVLQDTKLQQQSVLTLETTNVANYTAKVEALTQQMAQVTEGIRAAQEKLKAINDKIDAQNVKSSQIILERTDYYKGQPTEVGINFTANGPLAFIRNWDPDDGLGPRTLTSFDKDADVALFAPDKNMDWGAISDVKYIEKGGKFSMIVRAGRGYTFTIQFSRTDFSDPFKRMNFGGDIVRSRKGEPDRVGVIKLSDTKNL